MIISDNDPTIQTVFLSVHTDYDYLPASYVTFELSPESQAYLATTKQWINELKLDLPALLGVHLKDHASLKLQWLSGWIDGTNDTDDQGCNLAMGIWENRHVALQGNLTLPPRAFINNEEGNELKVQDTTLCLNLHGFNFRGFIGELELETSAFWWNELAHV